MKFENGGLTNKTKKKKKMNLCGIIIIVHFYFLLFYKSYEPGNVNLAGI